MLVELIEFNDGVCDCIRVKSSVDGKAMDGVSSIRIHSGTDYVGSGHLIRWTEVFLVKTDELINSRR